jgi:hypothetical protein
MWFSIEVLDALVRRHGVDDTSPRPSAPILRAQLVVVDDIGLLPISADAVERLYPLIGTYGRPAWPSPRTSTPPA